MKASPLCSPASPRNQARHALRGLASALTFFHPLVLALAMNVGLVCAAQAGTAYGSLNNFDAVNDTGVECHGFEIELEGIHSHDITYTFDWNHYGTPKITEDTSDPVRPRVRIRYEAAWKPNGTWSAYTAIPSGPIAPTDGHQFTNPSVNFGGEHFGAGFIGQATNITYHWLVDGGNGTLVRGAALSISTPAFAYMPPAALRPRSRPSSPCPSPRPSSNSAPPPG